MADATGFFQGSGGAIIEMNLPLPELYAEQVTKGHLRRVNGADDPGPYEGDAEGSEQGAEPVKPAGSAPKSEWVGWAVHNGATVDDAEAMTKADLIDKYGKD